MNDMLSNPTKTNVFIAVLDIYGFEVFRLPHLTMPTLSFIIIIIYLLMFSGIRA